MKSQYVRMVFILIVGWLMYLVACAQFAPDMPRGLIIVGWIFVIAPALGVVDYWLWRWIGD